jgi:hypothetical protein
VQCTTSLSAAAVDEAEGQSQGEGEGDEVQHTPLSSSSSAAAEKEGFSERFTERNVDVELEEQCKGVQHIASSSPAVVDYTEAVGEAETLQSIASSSSAQVEVEGGANKEARLEGDGKAAEYISSSSAAEAEWYAEGCADGEGGHVMASSSAAAEAEWYAEGETEEAQCTASTTAEAEVYGGGEDEGEGEGQIKGAQHVTSLIAAGGGDASLTVPDVPTISDIIALPTSENVTIPGSTGMLPVSLYEINDVVDVESRVWPGMNKPGGRARIIKVHTVYPSGGKRILQQ